MEIVTKKPWLDKQANKIRKIGEVQEVTEERYKEIVETLNLFKNVTWVEPVEELEINDEIPQFEEISVDGIKELLDQKGIEYKASYKKQELYDLLK